MTTTPRPTYALTLRERGRTFAYRLTLRPPPNCAEPELALRRLLKLAGRHGLRCVRIEQLEGDGQDGAA